jgi:photosystem II stability/assembly factor-like uncharacterized protein
MLPKPIHPAPVAVTLLISALLPSPARAQVASPAPSAVAPVVSSVDPSFLEGLEYRYVGPTRGGRVTAVAGHATQPNTFYFGGTGGGVFRTTDGGRSWENLTDGQIPVGSIGAIEVAPSNADIIYVATGSAAIRSNVSIGRGVYRSDDGGSTWRFVGLENAGVIGDMVVHPANPDVAFVAAVGNPFGRNPERGVFRTRDGGRTWDKVLFVSDSTGAVDIDMNPANPDELYAGMWRAERKPWTIISGAREGGIYKSTDGGDTWTKLTNGLPDEYVGKSSVSIARSNPNRVFALIEAGDGTLGVPGGVHGGLFRSDDAGATWTRTSNQTGLLNRPFYYTYVDVDPTNADVVYVNNETFWKSTDGGVTFERRSTPHGDNHGMWINPTNSDVFIQSNDGGVNVTYDGGRTWSSQNNQPTAEMYQVDIDDRYPYWIYAGQQDNTTIGVPSTGEGARPEAVTAWRTNVGGCETGPAVPQPGSDGQIFFSNCKGRFYRYSEITGQATEYSVGATNMYGTNPRDLKYRFQRVSPIVISPHDPDVVYHASQYVHRTTDGGRTWETISPDLTANDPRGHVVSGTPITRDVTGEEFYSTLYSVAESPVERGVIWTGANDGPVHVTRDNGVSWSNVTPPELPGGGRVQTVEASPHRAGSAYIAVLRYMFDDWSPHIYRTDDYGRTWLKLSGPASGFPQDHPTRVVREDPDREGLLYAGTEFGTFVSFDNGGTWQSFQQNLPATAVTDMKVHRRDLILATQGRGFWIADNLTPLHQLSDDVAAAPAHLFTPPTAYRGSGEPAHIDYHLGAPVQGTLALEIVDAAGSVIRSFTGDTSTVEPGARRPGMPGAQAGRFGGPGASARGPSMDAGLNRFAWDLRAASTTGRGAGPMVPPGRYTARLTVPGARTVSAPIVVAVDPRLSADGITADDLRAQYELAARIAQLAADVQQLQTDLTAARERFAGNARALARISAVEERVATRSAQAYPQPMLAAQVGYLNGIVSRGDNRPHRDAYERYEELRAAVDAVRQELANVR